MEIAKGIKASDYLKLQLSNFQTEEWLIAINFLEKRLIERYVEPVEVLIESEKHKSSYEKTFGFSILAIDCMLAETIQSFYEGITDSTGQSKKIFTSFLRRTNSFKEFFKSDQEAKDFYRNFRCGIVHQSQTFGNTKVWAVGELIYKVDKYIIVNRALFHDKIKVELNIYLEELRKKSSEELLLNFKRKMDFICG